MQCPPFDPLCVEAIVYSKLLKLVKYTLCSSSSGSSSSSKLQLGDCDYNQWRRHLVNAYEVEAGMV